MASGHGMCTSGREIYASSYRTRQRGYELAGATLKIRGSSAEIERKHTLSRSSRPRLRLVAGRLFWRSSLARVLSSSPGFFLCDFVAEEVDGFFVEVVYSRCNVRARSLFSSVGLRIRSPGTQSSHLYDSHQ